VSSEVLIIDDEEMFREDLARLLSREGYHCRTASTGEQGLDLAVELAPDVVLCDLMLPGVGGVEVVDRLSAICAETSVILVTAFGSLDTAVEAFRRGAADYLMKPFVPEDLVRKVRRCVEEQRLRREVHYLRRVVSGEEKGARLVGVSPAVREIRMLISKLAPARSSVLLCGETGTGKELVARAIHESGMGVQCPFIAINCASLPRDLFESELFGHTRGAFTGAVKDRKGLFELASGGTLFLDEIGELPLDLQPKLLRVLESGEMLPVGASRPVQIDVRIIAATNRELRDEIEAGRFREDLYYRLRVVEVRIPPLRKRREDIPPIAEHLLRKLNRRLGRHVTGLDHSAMRVLMAASWRGNVRELENVLERSLLLSEGETLTETDLGIDAPESVKAPEVPDNLKQAVRLFEASHIGGVLAVVDGNRNAAARRLGINPATLYRRLRDLDIED
jgi:two-component system response regulator PilR (NtrC family)